jgi:uncharacterized membrane protein
MSVKNEQEGILNWMKPWHRIAISLAPPAIAFFIISPSNIHALMKFMIVWDVFALTYITLSFIIFFTHSTGQIKKKAQTDDGSRFFVFMVVVVASFASMFTVLLLMLSKEISGSEKLYLPVAIAGMLLSWIMVHSVFTFHYAHLYYGDDIKGSKKQSEGLAFPEEHEPDYLDFAYFSFVIGMTFQVSDVEINSRVIRRTALVHGLLSFGLNTFVVALTINLIAGLRG